MGTIVRPRRSSRIIRRTHFAGGRHRFDGAGLPDRVMVGLASATCRLGRLPSSASPTFWALPLLVLALVMTAVLPSCRTTATILIPTVSRVIRSNVLSLREMPYIEAAKAIGMSELRIAVIHVLPNTLAPLIVLATAQLGSTILTEARCVSARHSRAYPSWGRMRRRSRNMSAPRRGW
jgi:peptide/nickel transport system permease protein